MTATAFNEVNKTTPKVSLQKACNWKYIFQQIRTPNYDNIEFLGKDYVEKLRTKYDAMQKYSVDYKEHFVGSGKYRVEMIHYWYGYDNELKETVSRCTVQVEYADNETRGWTAWATQFWLEAYLIKTDAITGEIVDEWGCAKEAMLESLFNCLPNS